MFRVERGCARYNLLLPLHQILPVFRTWCIDNRRIKTLRTTVYRLSIISSISHTKIKFSFSIYVRCVLQFVYCALTVYNFRCLIILYPLCFVVVDVLRNSQLRYEQCNYPDSRKKQVNRFIEKTLNRFHLSCVYYVKRFNIISFHNRIKHRRLQIKIKIMSVAMVWQKELAPSSVLKIAFYRRLALP